MRSSCCFLESLRSFLALGLLASTAVAQSVQLSGPLAGPAADVVAFAVDLAGTRAVYVADQDTLGVFELYGVPLDQSSPPVKLSGTMPPNGDVAGSPALLTAGGTVVYRADPFVDGAFELFSAPIDGSQPAVQLSGPMLAGRTIYHFALTPDGTRAVYSADQDTNEVYELFVAPVDGSAPAQKLPTVPPGLDVYGAAVDPTSTRAVYVSTFDVFGTFSGKVYSVALDGAAPAVELASHSDSSSQSPYLNQLTFSPDGVWAAYVVGRDNFPEATSRVYVVPLDGSAPAEDVSFSDVLTSSGVFTQDSARVVFAVGYSDFSLAYGWTLNSSTPTGVGLELATIGTSSSVPSLRLGPAGDTAFHAGHAVGRAAADGSASHTVLAAGSAGHTYRTLEVEPDGGRVVFVRRNLSGGTEQLRSVPSLGGPVVTLAPTPAGNVFGRFQFSADSSLVVYAAATAPSVHELFAVPSDGSRDPRRLNGSLPPGGTVSQTTPFVIAGPRVVYLASEDASGHFELFSSSLELRRRRLAPSPPEPVAR